MLIVSLIALQLIIFSTLIFFLRKIMTQNVTVATRHLDEMGQEYEKKERAVSKQLSEAKAKAQEIIVSAQQEMEALRQATLTQNESEKERVLKETRQEAAEIIAQADHSRTLLVQEIEERIAKAAVVKACELVQLALPDEFKRSVHSQWVRQLIDEAFSHLEKVSVKEEVKSVRVASAFALTDEERREISGKLSSFFGTDVSLAEEIDPRLVAGIVIHIGSLVLDGSLKFKILEKSRA